jgi:hypothetical protein
MIILTQVDKVNFFIKLWKNLLTILVHVRTDIIAIAPGTRKSVKPGKICQ